jgi:hypothetical protein
MAATISAIAAASNARLRRTRPPYRGGALVKHRPSSIIHWVYRRSLIAALASLALTGCGSDPAPPSIAGPPGQPALVVQDDAELLYRSDARIRANMRLLADLGVRSVRLTASWERLAPRARSPRRPAFDARDPAAYRADGWVPLDRAVREARAEGLGVMVDAGFSAPVWATAGDRSARPRRLVSPADLADFCAALARRYRGEVSAYTIWNEPNLPQFLERQFAGADRASPASPHHYRAMVAAALPAIRSVDAEAQVLIGGLAAYGRRRGVPPLRFVRELACVDARLRPVRGGACRGFERVEGDGFAHHPYSTATPPESVEPGASPDDVPIARIGELARLLDRLVAAGRLAPGLRDIYVTEYGYESNPPDAGAPYDPAQAARAWLGGEAIAAREPSVRTFAQFLVRDLPGTPGGQHQGSTPDWQSGLLFASGREKPLARILRRRSR